MSGRSVIGKRIQYIKDRKYQLTEDEYKQFRAAAIQYSNAVKVIIGYHKEVIRREWDERERKNKTGSGSGQQTGA